MKLNRLFIKKSLKKEDNMTDRQTDRQIDRQDVSLNETSCCDIRNTLSEYEKALGITEKDIKKFRIANLISPKNFNVGILIDDIDEEELKTLTYIEDVIIYSFKNISLINDKIKTLDTNSLKDLAIAIRNMHCIISNDLRIINIAAKLNVKTFAMLNQYLKFNQSSINQYINKKANQYAKTLCYVKKDLDTYRLELKEKHYLDFIEKINNSSLHQSRKLDIKSSILINELFEKTCNRKYLKEYIKTQEKLKYFQGYELSCLCNIASSYYLFTNEKDKAKKIWEKISSKIKQSNNYLIPTIYSQCLYNMGDFQGFRKYYPPILKLDRGSITKLSEKINADKLYKKEKNTLNKILLIHFECGFGDTLMYSKHISRISKKFKTVNFVVQKALKNLFETSLKKISNLKIYDEDEFLSQDIKYDYYIPIFSLQIALNISPNKDKKNKWILADKQKVKDFRKYFDKNKFNIGIFYESQKNKAKRFSDLETFMPLAYLDNVKLYSLHINKSDTELNYLDDNIEIVNLGKHFKDFSDTAAAIENCDLIVTTDSCILNLAGAMGKKTFALLSQFADWRWYKTEGDDIGWYKSVKPFQAEVENDFKPVIDKICDEIKPLVHQKKFKERR
jgi:ADP-heptose:LPS heptosyltransferase